MRLAVAAALASPNLVIGEESGDAGKQLLVRDSLRLLQTGGHADMLIRCGSTRWHVHRSIVLYRSAYLKSKLDFSRMHPDQIADQLVLWLRKRDHDPLLVDAYLVWLYTRSIALVAQAIGTSFRGNEAFGWTAFFRFAIETNLPRRGFEGVEKDNDEFIILLSDEISRIFKDDIEAFVASTVNVQTSSEGDLEGIAEAFGRVYRIIEEVDEDRSPPATELMKAIIGHMVFQALLVEEDLGELWERLLSGCPRMLEEFADQQQGSSRYEDLDGVIRGNGEEQEHRQR